MSVADDIQDFIRAMERAGVVPSSNIAGDLMKSAEIVRFACRGDERKKNFFLCQSIFVWFSKPFETIQTISHLRRCI